MPGDGWSGGGGAWKSALARPGEFARWSVVVRWDGLVLQSLVEGVADAAKKRTKVAKSFSPESSRCGDDQLGESWFASGETLVGANLGGLRPVSWGG